MIAGLKEFPPRWWSLLPPLTLALLAGAYFVTRPAGTWSESDTAAQAMAIRAMQSGGSYLAPDGYVYANGFGYAAVSHVLQTFSGLSVGELQRLAYPLISAMLVFPAWAFFAEVTRNRTAASLAVVLLLAQPEFQFVILRGSHERFMRLAMLVSLWLLARSLAQMGQPSAFARNVVLAYAVAFSLMATNVLFGLSFVVATGQTVVLAWLLSRLQSGDALAHRVLVRRLGFVVAGLLTLTFVVVFYVYPPSAHGLSVGSTFVRRLVEVVTTTESAVNPYAPVVASWVRLEVYFLVSTATYVLAAGSLVTWLLLGWRWWVRRVEVPGVGLQFLWLLYAALALQGLFAILADRVGLFGANLQHRSFPTFALAACPLLAYGLVRLRLRWPLSRLAGTAIGVLMGLAVLKATNEPLLSNTWTFYDPAELRAVEWAVRTRNGGEIWVGPDGRLAAAYEVQYGQSRPRATLRFATPAEETRTYVVSDVIRAHALRLGRTLPLLGDAHRIYDSGSEQVYRLRPATPAQR